MNLLKKIGRGLTNTLFWVVAIPLTAFGAYSAWTQYKKLQPVDIVIANKITEQQVKVDYIANRNSSAVKNVKERFGYMRRYTENDSLFKVFAGQLDSMDLKTIAQKAFAVDSLVDAQIKTESDYRLYGEYHWATPIETIRYKRGDDKNRSILKDALLEHVGVPARNAFLSVASRDSSAKNESLVVMVDTTATGDAPHADKVVMENDGGGKLTRVADKKYGYQVAFAKDSIIYITPPAGPAPQK